MNVSRGSGVASKERKVALLSMKDKLHFTTAEGTVTGLERVFYLAPRRLGYIKP